MNPVHRLLDDLNRQTRHGERLEADPVAFVHRYTDRADREVAAVLSSGMAFGRVAAFRPVLDRVFAVLDAAGGPAHAAVARSTRAELDSLIYRWIRGPDVSDLLDAVGSVLERHGSLEVPQANGDARFGLTALVDALRAATPRGYDRSRGLKALLSRPQDGSACKRWCMFHRWMVRRDGVDFGLWSRDPATLIIPVDTHVLRLSQFLGLTRRTDASWRTAEEITAALRVFDPTDPVRFDFALAHLGISGACRGRFAAEVCPGCPLVAGCAAAARRDHA